MSDPEWVSSKTVLHSKRVKRQSNSGNPDGSLGVVTTDSKNKMMDLIQTIMRKDVHMIFAEPVSDLIAPGYSSIISNPMDLSSMQAKVQRGEYATLKELKDDSDLMCKNCMVYNSDDTIFYKEAVKLQNYISSLFGEKKGKAPATMSTEVREGIRKKQEMQEEWRAEEITRSVKRAASAAKEKLDRFAGDTKVGYLSKEEDGTVLMKILNPEAGEPTEKPLDASYFTPHQNTTTSLLQNFREKKRQPNKAPEYLTYGPFGSFMPSYDSVFSSLDDGDQQLLYGCYGDELGLAYCRSVQEFAKGCHDSLRQPVDSIINSLTAGGHARANKLLAQKYAKIIREKRLTRARRLKNCRNKSGETSGAADSSTETDDVAGCEEKQPPDVENSDMKKEEKEEMREEESLLKLLESDDIPDIINDTELQMKLEQACEDSELQEKLVKNSDLLTSLHREQNTRLSQAPPSTEPVLWDVGSTENNLAAKVRDNLTYMISGHAEPREVVSQVSVRGAMSSALVDEVGKL